MTRTVIYKHGSDYTGFSIEGHSGFADAGEDIVCAAVSILGINTANAITELAPDGAAASIVSDEETALLSLRMPGKPGNETQLLIKALELGIRSVIEQYGNDYISLNIEEV